MAASTRASSPTTWERLPATHTFMSQVTSLPRRNSKLIRKSCHYYIYLFSTDIVPDPPDGPPVVESITGKTLTLSWKKPNRMEQSTGMGALNQIIVIAMANDVMQIGIHLDKALYLLLVF